MGGCKPTNIDAYYRGTLVSIAAAILILVLLVESLIHGFATLFTGANTTLMLSLIALGVLAAYYYSLSDSFLAARIRLLAPLILTVAFVGVLLGALVNPLIGGGLIVAAYFLEAGVGVPLYHLSLTCHRTGAWMFISGVLFFTFTLPLVVLDRVFSILPLIGDLVKMAGLILLALESRLSLTV